MTSTCPGSFIILAIICIVFFTVTVARDNNLYAFVPISGALQDLSDNNHNYNYFQRVSEEETEEETSNIDVCNRYLETCPTSTPTLTPTPPASDTIDEADQSFRERYLEQNRNDGITTTNASSPPGQARFLNYQNNDEKVRLQYPSDWQISERGRPNERNPAVVTFYSPYESDSDSYAEVVDVRAQNLSDQDKAITTEQYLAKVISSYRQQSPNFKIIEANPKVLFGSNDLPGYKLVFTMTDNSVGNNNTELKVTETGTIDNEVNRTFFIRPFVEDKKSSDYLPVTEKMTKSVELLK
jgi:hypothetical protein